jgi:Mn-dependent DtxR family transcriptional regulator
VSCVAEVEKENTALADKKEHYKAKAMREEGKNNKYNALYNDIQKELNVYKEKVKEMTKKLEDATASH